METSTFDSSPTATVISASCSSFPSDYLKPHILSNSSSSSSFLPKNPNYRQNLNDLNENPRIAEVVSFVQEKTRQDYLKDVIRDALISVEPAVVQPPPSSDNFKSNSGSWTRRTIMTKGEESAVSRSSGDSTITSSRVASRLAAAAAAAAAARGSSSSRNTGIRNMTTKSTSTSMNENLFQIRNIPDNSSSNSVGPPISTKMYISVYSAPRQIQLPTYQYVPISKTQDSLYTLNGNYFSNVSIDIRRNAKLGGDVHYNSLYFSPTPSEVSVYRDSRNFCYKFTPVTSTNVSEMWRGGGGGGGGSATSPPPPTTTPYFPSYYHHYPSTPHHHYYQLPVGPTPRMQPNPRTL